MKDGNVTVGDPTALCDDPIETMAVNAAGTKCLLAHGKALHLHNFPEVDGNSTLVYESMLDFTQVEFLRDDSMV